MCLPPKGNRKGTIIDEDLATLLKVDVGNQNGGVKDPMEIAMTKCKAALNNLGHLKGRKIDLIGDAESTGGPVGTFNIKGCTDSIVEYLNSHDDGEKNSLTKFVDHLKYNTKAQPSKKGYRPCLWSLAKRFDILNIMVEKLEKGKIVDKKKCLIAEIVEKNSKN